MCELLCECWISRKEQRELPWDQQQEWSSWEMKIFFERVTYSFSQSWSNINAEKLKETNIIETHFIFKLAKQWWKQLQNISKRVFSSFISQPFLLQFVQWKYFVLLNTSTDWLDWMFRTLGKKRRKRSPAQFYFIYVFDTHFRRLVLIRPSKEEFDDEKKTQFYCLLDSPKTHRDFPSYARLTLKLLRYLLQRHTRKLIFPLRRRHMLQVVRLENVQRWHILCCCCRCVTSRWNHMQNELINKYSIRENILKFSNAADI